MQCQIKCKHNDAHLTTITSYSFQMLHFQVTFELNIQPLILLK